MVVAAAITAADLPMTNVHYTARLDLQRSLRVCYSPVFYAARFDPFDPL